MTELKTLKDFKITYDNGTSFFELDDWRTNSGEWFVKKLKEEAIKWYHRSDDNKHKFIMEFFNITEKEIKDASRGISE